MPPLPVQPRYKSTTSDVNVSESSDKVLRKLQQVRCTRLSVGTDSPKIAPVKITHVSSDGNKAVNGSTRSTQRRRRKTELHSDRNYSPPASPVTPAKDIKRVPSVSRSPPPRITNSNVESRLDSRLPRTHSSSQSNASLHCYEIDEPLTPEKTTLGSRKVKGSTSHLTPNLNVSRKLLDTESPSWCFICSQGNATNSAHICELRLNQVEDKQIYEFFEAVPGLGKKLASRVISSRAGDGPFLSAADFDRRISRLSFARLSAAAMSCSFSVSLNVTMQQMPGRTIAGCSIQVSLNPNVVLTEHKESISESSLLTVSTWNAAHLSLRSKFIKKKMAHFVRFALDASPLVVALQEVYGDVPAFIASSLTVSGCDGEQWSSCSPEPIEESSNTSNTEKMTQAFCYRSDAITATDLSAVIPETLLSGFLRPPAIAMFSPQSESIGVIHEQTLTLINVHLSTRFFTSEVAKLPAVIEFVRDYISGIGGNPDLVMCLGDFNVSADAECFECFKEIGFTELVRPPSAADPSVNKQYITTPTTVGGNWYDNIFMSRCARQSLENAWCFDFGGRCAALADSSAHEYAGNRRSQRSDHLALVAQYRFR